MILFFMKSVDELMFIKQSENYCLREYLISFSITASYKSFCYFQRIGNFISFSLFLDVLSQVNKSVFQVFSAVFKPRRYSTQFFTFFSVNFFFLARMWKFFK